MATGSEQISYVRHIESEYDALRPHLQDRFDKISRGRPLFTTSATGLFDTYLETFPAEQRQHYNCHACRQFIDTYGGIVMVDADTGALEPLLWGDDGPLASMSVVLRHTVMRARITGVALFDQRSWGQPRTGAWYHLAIVPDPARVFASTALKTASQAVAEKLQERGMIGRSLDEFPPEAVAQAVTMLEADVLYASEKVLGVATWLRDLHAKRAAVGKVRADHVTWLAVATAPPGFAHVRTSMIGTLLEDIVAGLPFDEIRRKFAAKMAPTAYQRPTAPPSAGTIARAETIIAEMKAAGSLDRRFARLDDLTAVWRPTPPTKPSKADANEVFGHIKPKGAAPKVPSVRQDLPTITMTWDKFQRTVLPTARSVSFFVPRGDTGFHAFLTAANPDAPPILQWDRAEKRNPVSMYVYASGSPARQWGLTPENWVDVTAITLGPSQWDPEHSYDHHGKSVYFVLSGAMDSRNSGNALFPSMLRSELHEIRSVIEAYSKTATLTGREAGNACGIAYASHGTWTDCIVRVTSVVGDVLRYKLDRWD